MFRNIRSIVKGSLSKSRLAAAALAISVGTVTVASQAQVINPFLVQPQQSVALPPVNPIAQPATPQYPAYPAQQVPQQVPQQVAQPAQQVGAARLTIEQVGQVLDAIQPGKNTVNDNGETYYTLSIKQGDLTVPLTIQLSPNGNVLWIYTTLTHITDVNRVSPTALMNLLQKNADLGPTFFQISGNKHAVQLIEPIANYGLNVDSVRGRIADFIQVIQQTESLWSDQALMP